jgi:hypothetical protein
MILFALKWVFLALVYGVLFLLLTQVGRELNLRLPRASAAAEVSFGRLRVLRPGVEKRLQTGALLALKPEMTLGSHSDNDLVLNDHFVSGKHAALRWDGVTWWVEDLGSMNGTYVDQQRLTPGAATALANGAVLEVGDIHFEMVE